MSEAFRMPTEEEPATLLLGDCLEALTSLNGDGFALITDPPYGINHMTGFSPSCAWYDRPIVGDDSPRLRDTAIAWARQVKAPWACFGTWKVAPPEATRGILIWDKGPAFGLGDLSFPWKPSWEMICVGGPG